MTLIKEAWAYERATRLTSGGYTGWENRVSIKLPDCPEGSIRGLTRMVPAIGKVHVVTGEHFAVPGRPMQVFSSLGAAKGYALGLANMLRQHVDLPIETDPDKWEQAVTEARRKHAENLGYDQMRIEDDDLDVEDDGWVQIDTLVLDPEEV